jgi:hypothetical protein
MTTIKNKYNAKVKETDRYRYNILGFHGIGYTHMKKIGILLVLMLFVLSVSGCRLFGHKKHNRNDYGCYDFSSSIPQTKFRVNKEPKLLKPKTESKPEQRETPKEPPKVERKVVEDRVAIYYPPKKPEDRVVEYGKPLKKDAKHYGYWDNLAEEKAVEWKGSITWHPEKKVEDRVVEYVKPPKVEDRVVEYVKPLKKDAKHYGYWDNLAEEKAVEWKGSITWHPEKKVEDRVVEYVKPPTTLKDMFAEHNKEGKEYSQHKFPYEKGKALQWAYFKSTDPVVGWPSKEKVEDRVVEYREPPKVEDRVVEYGYHFDDEDKKAKKNIYSSHHPFEKWEDPIKEPPKEKKVEDRVIKSVKPLNINIDMSDKDYKDPYLISMAKSVAMGSYNALPLLIQNDLKEAGEDIKKAWNQMKDDLESEGQYIKETWDRVKKSVLDNANVYVGEVIYLYLVIVAVGAVLENLGAPRIPIPLFPF